MSRIAVVTGGTRGIGAAIATALKDAGYKVVASYAGNDEAANKFKAETGIEVMKWDVGNYEACEPRSRRSRTTLVRWISSSIMPASPVMPCSTR
jgi:NAD(P)-dependent dehydrogenase (short-subunit alcohol dehydrogenase family)